MAFIFLALHNIIINQDFLYTLLSPLLPIVMKDMRHKWNKMQNKFQPSSQNEPPAIHSALRFYSNKQQQFHSTSMLQNLQPV